MNKTIRLFVLVCIYITFTEAEHLRDQVSDKRQSFSNKNTSLSQNDGINDASSYTKVYLFTREMGLNYTEIVPNNRTSLDESGYNVTKNTKMVIHGWLSGPFTEFPNTTRDAYLATQDVNMLVVDWSKASFLKGMEALDEVGQYMGHFLSWLVTDAGVSADSIHIMGHSLGGQIVGAVGEYFNAGRIGRISGLDPTGPGFGPGTHDRLDPTDAQFVDVIHTNGLQYGYFYACGHVDFYVNGGSHQPGCPLVVGDCSHLRAFRLFVESIYSERFVSRKCDSWVDYTLGTCDHRVTTVMGEHVDLNARGKYYLRTTSKPPYALGDPTNTRPT